ncbi:PDZ domain-containing protein [Chryseobacterium sp. SNU WT5]|uniref:PDZ domain-containing protein n=1 Tax=Chryseobacterium sp. SNU WT5 TaxID=2594269 RepID=UPI001E61C550|nr:PDZ domain-containing protein [Chryseobacterium sp. SNU WT5]
MKFLFLLITLNSFAQQGFQISDSKKTVIPFKLINNLIFIPVNVNGVGLTFLLDSGVKESILFSLENKEINFNEIEKVKFSGLGESMDIEGLSSRNNLVTIGKDYRDIKHTIYIILDEGINFSSHIGIPVNGIMGYNFFANHKVEINYSSKKITVYNNNAFAEKRLRKFKDLPITIENNKPYIMTGVEMTGHKIDSKMLIDLGNSDAVWLFPKLIENFEYNRPNIDDYLGRGFNGDIFGKRSRIHRIYIGDFIFEKPLTAMPDEYSIQNLKLVPNRKGSIGNELLRRFTVVFDYPDRKILLKKNKFFRDAFLFNASGLDIQHDGMDWEKDLVKIETVRNSRSTEAINVYQAESGFRYNFVLKPKFSVAGCRKDSPCFVAGIRKNDQIISVNNKKTSELTLQKINNILKEDDGTRVKIQVQRAGEILNFTITLVDPIPYKDEN